MLAHDAGDGCHFVPHGLDEGIELGRSRGVGVLLLILRSRRRLHLGRLRLLHAACHLLASGHPALHLSGRGSLQALGDGLEGGEHLQQLVFVLQLNHLSLEGGKAHLN